MWGEGANEALSKRVSLTRAGADLEGEGFGEFSKYTSQRTTFQDFRHYQGGFLYTHFENFRLPTRFARQLLYNTIIISVHLNSVNTTGQFCRLPWIFQRHASFIYFLHLCRTTPPPLWHNYIIVHSHLSKNVKVRMYVGCPENRRILKPRLPIIWNRSYLCCWDPLSNSYVNFHSNL